MSLKDWFASKKKTNKRLDAKGVNQNLSDNELNELWGQCFGCQANLPKKEFAQNLQVCPKCGYHLRIGAWERINQLTCGENDYFEEIDANLTPADPLNFEDTKKYADRKALAHQKTQLNEAIITGLATINDEQIALGVMDFTFLGGSMGSVVGEKITRLIERAIETQRPVVIITSSGGARMQEGTFSLMQMVKSGAALARLHEAGLLYISILTEPTFGGVTASFGMLGDIILAEKGSRIGFAGRRVIEQTIRQKLPTNFQTASYLLEFGQIDSVVERKELRDTLTTLTRLHRRSSKLEPVSRTHKGKKMNSNHKKPVALKS